jgi:hypothetical protein
VATTFFITHLSIFSLISYFPLFLYKYSGLKLKLIRIKEKYVKSHWRTRKETFKTRKSQIVNRKSLTPLSI